MLFSRWPFDQEDPADAACFKNPGNEVDLGGCSGEIVSNDWEDQSGDTQETQTVRYTCAYGYDLYQDSLGFDGYAKKGIGYARFIAPQPNGRVVNVFFTHTQSTVGDAYEFHESLDVRKRQMDRANELISCIMSHRNAQNEAVVLMGDLNIEGDLSNPFAGPIGQSGHWVTSRNSASWVWDDKLWETPGETRNEWEDMFGNSNPRINAAGLKDTWANYMTPQCIPPAQQQTPQEECSVIGYNPNDLASYQKGNVTFDRGVTWASDPREERLDYIHVGHAPAFDQYASLPQHVSRANNLLVESLRSRT
jgi:hypothetical protein